MVLGELEHLTRFIFGGHNIKKIRYEDDIVLTAEAEINLQELRQNVIKGNIEMEKKVEKFNCKKEIYMVFSNRIIQEAN